MRKLLSICAIILCSIYGNAQKNAQEILDKVSANIQGYNNVSIDFEYTSGATKHKGKLYLEKNKYNEFYGINSNI